ncbi:uncharacterized protein [Nerophis lumbriciformis]|uniref:uncharacterized protein n=1 Tax=Nerophis lumbriciformis TaxID=546530 RepID=UPI002AE01C9E|nr:uncharacterized protein LOC133613997 [Nerophis lumbriciformis]
MAFNISPNLDSLLCQLVVEFRELSAKKKQIDQQIEVYRADIAERRTYIEKTRRNIDEVGEEIGLKRNTLKHNREVAKSMKATQGLLLQYERTLRAELESIKVNYNNDKDVYADKIVSYRQLFQAHKKPFAQKLQAYNDDMEGGHHLETVAQSSSSEQSADSDPQQLHTNDPAIETQPSFLEDSITAITSVILDEKKRWQSGPEAAADGTTEDMGAESEVQKCSADKTRGNKQSVKLNPQTEKQHEMHSEEEEDQEIVAATVSEIEEAAEEDMEERAAEQEQTLCHVNNEEQVTLPPLPCEVAHPQSSSTPNDSVPVTPSFHFKFSPACSPIQETSDNNKSPAFTFSLTSNPCTPGFSGFGFDVVSSNDEVRGAEKTV